MNQLLIGLLFFLCIASCKSKKTKPEVPAANLSIANDYVKGQIAQLDTSLYSFLKIETVNGISDTTPIKNSEVKLYAKDFLELPDISSVEVKDDYEINHLYDDELEAFAFTFTTKEDHPVKSEHVLVEPMPNAEGKNDIRSIFVDLWLIEDDTSIRKNMLWETAKSFQITTTTESPGGVANIKRVRVIWNGFKNQNK